MASVSFSVHNVFSASDKVRRCEGETLTIEAPSATHTTPLNFDPSAVTSRSCINTLAGPRNTPAFGVRLRFAVDYLQYQHHSPEAQLLHFLVW